VNILQWLMMRLIRYGVTLKQVIKKPTDTGVGKHQSRRTKTYQTGYPMALTDIQNSRRERNT
jgi:hypothetical protein